MYEGWRTSDCYVPMRRPYILLVAVICLGECNEHNKRTISVCKISPSSFFFLAGVNFLHLIQSITFTKYRTTAGLPIRGRAVCTSVLVDLEGTRKPLYAKI